MSVTLLIIEDSPSMLHMYQGFLQKEPFRILKAETGKAGLRILRDQRPELLLLDLKLPDIDGQQILELIAEERLGTTTLVMEPTQQFLPKHAMRTRLAHAMGVNTLCQAKVEGGVLRRAHHCNGNTDPTKKGGAAG